MYEAGFELEAELEDLMTSLARSDLQSEAELFAPVDAIREQGVISNLVARGVRNENEITDAVFFNRHPERNGRRLTPGESALIQEWTHIRDQLVRPFLGNASVTQSSYPTRSGTPQWVANLVPLLDRYRGQTPARPGRYAGEIPLYVLLGWINVESAGNIKSTTRLNELGYFQLHPEESKDLGLPSHSRLGTDPEYSTWAGIELVRSKAWGALHRGFQDGDELFWRVSKWLHWLPGVVDLILNQMRSAGVDPKLGWDVVQNYVIANRDRLNSLTRKRRKVTTLGNWDVKVGIDNVNKTIDGGKQLAVAISRL